VYDFTNNMQFCLWSVIDLIEPLIDFLVISWVVIDPAACGQYHAGVCGVSTNPGSKPETVTSMRSVSQ
jgi:hypothetical protein